MTLNRNYLPLLAMANSIVWCLAAYERAASVLGLG
jgi:hypothetical protein